MEVELVLLIMSLLFFASIATDKVGNRFGVPALLLFLVVGLIFNPDTLGLGKMSIATAQAMGSVALCIILFSGGMDTKLSDIRPVINPGVSLATVGVLVTCAVTGFIIWLMMCLYEGKFLTALIPFSLLVAATMSSTDSASVFSILRTQGIGLKHNLRPMLELESGANDPMAYILTTTLIGIVVGSNPNLTWLMVIQTIFVQLVVGVAIGFLAGQLLVWIMRRTELANESLYPILVLSACIFIFGVAHYMGGNSYLAVYMGGLIIGNSKFTRKRQTRSFFDGLTWLSQLIMFLMLGLMCQPKNLLDWDVIGSCLIISVTLMFISRPVATFVSLSPFKEYSVKEKTFVSWVGLRGATPIIFAILCEAAGVEDSDKIFNIVFLCTLVSLIIQGTTLSTIARFLGVATHPVKLHRLRHFDLDLPEEIESSVTELEVKPAMLEQGVTLRDITLPKKTLVIMVRRGESFFVPLGETELEVGDQLLIITDDDAMLAQQYMAEENAREANDWRVQLLTNTGTFVKERAKVFMEGKKKV